MKNIKPIPLELVPKANEFVKLANIMSRVIGERRTLNEVLIKYLKPGRYGTISVIRIGETTVKAHKRRGYTYVRSTVWRNE